MSERSDFGAGRVGIRKLSEWKVFGDEGFGECRARDIGFCWIEALLFGFVWGCFENL